MKPFRFIPIILNVTFIALFLTFVSCQKNDELANAPEKQLLGPDTDNTSLTLNEPLTLKSGMVLPSGTIISKIPDDPYSLQYELPDSYRVYDKSGRVALPEVSTQRGKVTCTCTKGSGCSPYVASLEKKTIGCNMSSKCTSCDQKITNRVGTTIEVPELINLNLKTEIIADKDMLSKTTSPTASFFDLPEVQKELRLFAKAFQHSNLENVYNANLPGDLPEGYSMVAISVFGKAVMIPIDADMAPFATGLGNFAYNPHKSARVGNIALPVKAMCECSAGNKKGCNYGSRKIPFVGSIEWCDAGGCTQCSLSF